MAKETKVWTEVITTMHLLKLLGRESDLERKLFELCGGFEENFRIWDEFVEEFDGGDRDKLGFHTPRPKEKGFIHQILFGKLLHKAVQDSKQIALLSFKYSLIYFKTKSLLL